MSEALNKLLIVDDDVAVTNYFMVFLMQTELFEPEIENDSRVVIQLLKDNHYDVMMLDLDMPNVTGLEILKMMKAEGIDVPVVILTGANDVDLAVRAMKNGAFDYLTKPVDDEHLLEVLGNAVEMGNIKQSMDEMPDEPKREDLGNKAAFEHLPTSDPAMVRLFHQAEALAGGNLCVFLWGERGSGKRWLAQGIHNASARGEGPFLAIDCTHHAPDELSGVLFGRAPKWNDDSETLDGAFADAKGGTLFINNLEYLSPQVQMRLNHAMHTGEYYQDNSTEILQCDVRIITASTHDLTSSRFQESFSRDLLYHVMVNSLQLPALRERPDDIPLLARFFLEIENERSNKGIEKISPKLLEKLEQYFFPGNLKELRSIILHGVSQCQGDTLDFDDLSEYSRERISLGGFGDAFIPRPLKAIIVEQIKATLKYCHNDQKDAARILEISPEELQKHLAE